MAVKMKLKAVLIAEAVTADEETFIALLKVVHMRVLMKTIEMKRMIRNTIEFDSISAKIDENQAKNTGELINELIKNVITVSIMWINLEKWSWDMAYFPRTDPLAARKPEVTANLTPLVIPISINSN